MSKVFIHETAVVDHGTRIGDGTKIWHFCHIMEGAEIGENCVLGQNVFVGKGVRIGDGVKIQNNVSVFSGVTIEREVFVGPSVVFTNVINPRAGIERKEEFKPTLVRTGASIGANATIVCGNEIGQYAMIGAASVVTRLINAYELVVGNPSKQIGWMSRAGYRLEFDSEGRATCGIDGTEYRLIDESVICVT